MSVTIKSINTMPELDPYQRDTGQATYTELWLDPQERIATVDQEYRTGATTFAIWHSCELTFRINGHPKADGMKEYLESDEVQSLLNTICDGHSIEWDGNNHVGHFTEDALNAKEKLERDLAEYYDSDGWNFWDVDNWLQYGVDELTADTTDEEIKALAETIESDAKCDSVILNGDIVEHLTDRRDEMRDENE